MKYEKIINLPRESVATSSYPNYIYKIYKLKTTLENLEGNEILNKYPELYYALDDLQNRIDFYDIEEIDGIFTITLFIYNLGAIDLVYQENNESAYLDRYWWVEELEDGWFLAYIIYGGV